jgi:inosine/xanthosine triphosphate pyrophosphatase family protein
MQIVLASGNPGKQREFAALLAAYGHQLTLQSALPPTRCSRRRMRQR